MEELNDVDRRNALAADIRLIRAFSLDDEDAAWSEDARAAYERLHRNFIARVYAFCKRRLEKFLPQDVSLKAFVFDVFEGFVRGAHSFDPDVAATFSGLERLVLSWLHQQAKWKLRDYLKKVKVQRREYHEWAAEMRIEESRRQRRQEPVRHNPVLMVKRQKLDEVLRTQFDDRAREVLLASISHRDPETGEFNLPADLRNQLKADWQFNSDNSLNVYRKRQWERLQKLATVA